MGQLIETQSLVESLISENVMLREHRDEAEKALHRLPTPPKEMGDGPDERAINALQLWQSALLWAALWKRRAKLTKSQRDFLSAHFRTLSERLMEMEAELELWQRRANAQLEITRAAMEIVNAPFQIFDGRTGQHGYRISTQEFEDLEKAVKQYRDAAKLEEQDNGTNANKK